MAGGGRRRGEGREGGGGRREVEGERGAGEGEGGAGRKWWIPIGSKRGGKRHAMRDTNQVLIVITSRHFGIRKRRMLTTPISLSIATPSTLNKGESRSFSLNGTVDYGRNGQDKILGVQRLPGPLDIG